MSANKSNSLIDFSLANICLKSSMEVFSGSFCMKEEWGQRTSTNEAMKRRLMHFITFYNYPLLPRSIWPFWYELVFQAHFQLTGKAVVVAAWKPSRPFTDQNFLLYSLQSNLMVILAAFRRMGIISLEIGSLLMNCNISIDGRLPFWGFTFETKYLFEKRVFL